MIKRLLKKVFTSFLPIYFPGECKKLFIAIWSAPIEPAKLVDRWKALRITIRSHTAKRERILIVLKKGIIN